ncbi:hypothetical protein FNF27_01194 [Cafeteria roenbergensis]|uniref:Uncharacterized protein n=2 Tax=Cafeteria roenbergensis TaxID=33653 RepID=A0A5A8EHS7_CAFRO|nr:hypothetical protein FNF31_06503 [Cafeteria roenbergensis]KAA0156665.1 hypothetical protein FNF29_00776 [Cafeteria roenbergensis]KAA0177416.1 hypothetical protein FNF27_01194 [Cafeteria roenbergensis]|eukprot:KAA0156665.1 hypothetical protein FNF29_00776 [Cafeteria roenbergensis]
MADTAAAAPGRPAAPAADPATLRHLRFICLNGDVHDFRKFMERHKGFDLNSVVDTGRDHTPLMLACDNPQATELVRILIEEFGVDVNSSMSERKLTPLHIACKAGADGATMLLIDNGADVTARDLVGRSPLHWACIGSSLDVVKSIVRRWGAPALDVMDDSEYTPLMFAAEHNRADIAAFLLACGASRDAKNKLSHTAAELADWYGHFDVLKLVDEGAWAMATKALQQHREQQAGKEAADSAEASEGASSSAAAAAGDEARAAGPAASSRGRG